jgi:mRNA interferase RelE/StbE
MTSSSRTGRRVKYAFRWRERAVRQLRAIPQPAALTILRALAPLGDDPRRPDADVRKLAGYDDRYRLRVGDYRVSGSGSRRSRGTMGYPGRTRGSPKRVRMLLSRKRVISVICSPDRVSTISPCARAMGAVGSHR